MKHQKRIIQHLIQQSKISFEPTTTPFPSQQQKQQQNMGIQTIDSTVDQDIHNISVQFQPTYMCEVYVEIGDGRTDIIYLNEKSDPYKEAQIFCNKHKLEKYIVELLGDSLAQQARRQKNMIQSQLNSQVLGEKSTKIIGAEKLLSRNKIYKFNKNSQQLWKEPEQIFTGHPKINEVSDQIVKKIGKDKIIEAMNKKFHEKVQQHIMEQIENQQKQFEGYSFHPHINPISRKVDQTLNNSREYGARYEHLYEQHKVILNRKQEKRRNSMMEIPFKPAINKVSKTIMAKKRSLGDLYTYSSGKQRAKSNKKHYITLEQQQRKKKASNSLSLNSSNLCYHLYEQAKKRKQKIRKQADKIYKNPQNNWKIMQNSNCLITTVRQNKIKEIFYNLSNPPHKTLHHSQIDFNNLNEVQKIFMPVFKEMKDIDTDLTEEQFVQAGIRLLKYLSPNQKAILTRRNSHFQENNKQNYIITSQINKRSKQIVRQKGYGQKNIYVRGLMFKKQVKNQIQKGKQEKVRKQLQGCTFKPKIHGVPQNIGY